MKSQPAEVMSLESSLSELRDPTQYVGLKNLGATCYVNSLIQMWFHNEDMRYVLYLLNSLYFYCHISTLEAQAVFSDCFYVLDLDF